MNIIINTILLFLLSGFSDKIGCEIRRNNIRFKNLNILLYIHAYMIFQIYYSFHVWHLYIFVPIVGFTFGYVREEFIYLMIE